MSTHKNRKKKVHNVSITKSTLAPLNIAKWYNRRKEQNIYDCHSVAQIYRYHISISDCNSG